MIEASNWASGKQLRQLFVTILMFCEVSDTLNLWESNWKLLTEDILNRQRNVLQFHELILSEKQLRDYGLYEIEQILQQHGRSLKDYPQMPQPDLDIIIHNGNRLIQEEMSYNISSLKREHEILFSGLNNEQRPIYNSIMEAVTLERGECFLSTDMAELEKHIFIEPFCLLLDQKVKLLSLLPLQALLLCYFLVEGLHIHDSTFQSMLMMILRVI